MLVANQEQLVPRDFKVFQEQPELQDRLVSQDPRERLVLWDLRDLPAEPVQPDLRVFSVLPVLQGLLVRLDFQDQMELQGPLDKPEQLEPLVSLVVMELLE